MTNTRVCCICNIPLKTKRRDARTCSSSCRGRLFRSNRAESVLVRFRVPLAAYTNLAVVALRADKSINQYLSELVVKQHG
ncbi:protein of unknown function [Pseudomonas inefficax]|uniref:Uncharacterized protein n=1 Tax=Pseudomonas inefficax TaxID=2078786 RepID=A0AAQ1PE81_9PSED|nr:protein of unknown function [Pseudomonas inefficax]